MIQDTDMNADFHNGPNLGLEPTTPGQVTYQNSWLVPAGWKLVPEEPASRQVCYIAMEIQGVDEKGYCRFDDPRWSESVKTAERAYKAALEGAHEPPAAPQADDARDAARYRLLRKGAVDDVAVVRGLGSMDYGMSAVIYTFSEELDGDDLDAAIDAAMSKEGRGDE